jgi:hypothetical protein
VSAAADSGALKSGSRFTILRCGTEDVTAAICARLKSPTWTIVDLGSRDELPRSAGVVQDRA